MIPKLSLLGNACLSLAFRYFHQKFEKETKFIPLVVTKLQKSCLVEISLKCYYKPKKLHNHPIETVRSNGQLAVNCSGFGCALKCYFLRTPKFLQGFPLESIAYSNPHYGLSVWRWNFPNVSVTIYYHILIYITCIQSKILCKILCVRKVCLFVWFLTKILLSTKIFHLKYTFEPYFWSIWPYSFDRVIIGGNKLDGYDISVMLLLTEGTWHYIYQTIY